MLAIPWAHARVNVSGWQPQPMIGTPVFHAAPAPYSGANAVVKSGRTVADPIGEGKSAQNTWLRPNQTVYHVCRKAVLEPHGIQQVTETGCLRSPSDHPPIPVHSPG